MTKIEDIIFTTGAPQCSLIIYDTIIKSKNFAFGKRRSLTPNTIPKLPEIPDSSRSYLTSFTICVLNKNTWAHTGFEPEIGDSHYEGGALMKSATVSPNYFDSTNCILFLYKIIKDYLSQVHVTCARRKL